MVASEDIGTRISLWRAALRYSERMRATADQIDAVALTPGRGGLVAGVF